MSRFRILPIPMGGGGVQPSGTLEIRSEGTFDVTNYAEVDVDIFDDTTTKTIDENGTYNASDDNVLGYSQVTVNVPASAVVSGTKSITTNGNGQDVTNYASVDVNVPASEVVSGTKNIIANGTEDVTNYANVNVQVPASAVVSGTLNIVNNGTYDITNYANVNIQVASGNFNELCFTALQANSYVWMGHNGTNSTTTKPTMYYSTDNRQTWTLWDSSSISLPNVGDKVYFYGQNLSGFNYNEGNSSRFGMYGQFSVSGNIMSLITRYGDRDIPNGGCFCYLFVNQGALIDAQDLILPAMTTDYCYDHMFYNCGNLATVPSILPAMEVKYRSYRSMFGLCNSLTTHPQLPATKLGNGSYSGMFAQCRSLTTAPELPATTLDSQCYWAMFQGCTSLTKAPYLPATKTGNSSYYEMFNGCSNLNEISVGVTEWSDYNSSNWVSGVAASGTFYKMKDVNITVDSASGIPTGWTVVEIPVVVDDNNEISFNAATGTTIYYTTDGSTPTTSSTLYTGPIDARSIGDKFTLKYLSVFNNTELPVMEYEYYYMFYVEALENNTVLNVNNWRDNMYYSTDKQTWAMCNTVPNRQLALANAGDKAYFRKSSVSGVQMRVGNIMTVSGTIKVGGYLEYAATWDIGNNPALTHSIGNMFQNCTGLVDASDFILIDDMSGYDAGYVDADGPYYCMFDGCTSLTATPVFRPAILNHMAYQYMFRNCTSLVNAPNLPTTSDNGKRRIYRQMFYGCTSLVNGPTIGLTGSFQWQDLAEMFRGCTNLVSVAVPNITNWNTSNAENWLYGVAANGVVYANSNITLNSASGVPTGWVEIVPKTTPNAYDVKMSRNSVWVVLQNEWPNGTFILGNARPSDGGDFVGTDEVEIYVRDGSLRYDDNWSTTSQYGDFNSAQSYTYDNGKQMYLSFDIETGYEIDFDRDFEDCSDWQIKGYSDFEDCNCNENQLDCPPEP